MKPGNRCFIKTEGAKSCRVLTLKDKGESR